jgi:hypothetical protein
MNEYSLSEVRMVILRSCVFRSLQIKKFTKPSTNNVTSLSLATNEGEDDRDAAQLLAQEMH